MPEHCLHEDRWNAIQADIDEVKDSLKKDTTASWVRWALPIAISMIIAVAGFFQDKISAMETNVEARFEASVNDRRQLAMHSAELEARQKEQFERILSELKHLNDRVSELKR